MRLIPRGIEGALCWVSPTVPGTHLIMHTSMKKSTDATLNEPVGIVISGGHASSEAAPRFSAYIWAPAPGEEVSEEVQAA